MADNIGLVLRGEIQRSLLAGYKYNSQTRFIMSVAGALKIEGTGLQTFVTLNDGHKMPMFGLGCFKSQVGDETQNAVVSALKSGYRMIDTATFYK